MPYTLPNSKTHVYTQRIKLLNFTTTFSFEGQTGNDRFDDIDFVKHGYQLFRQGGLNGYVFSHYPIVCTGRNNNSNLQISQESW